MDKKFSARLMEEPTPRTAGLHINIPFVATWFAMAGTALIFSLTFFLYLSNTKTVQPNVQSFKLYAALPKSEVLISDDISHADGRAKIVENFFKAYKAPLADYSNTFIEMADKYNFD